MSTEHQISRKVSGRKGLYVIKKGDERAALTFTILSPDRIVADHTFVPESFRGTGAGFALVTRLVADARAEGFLIVPHCPYVNAQREKHPEWADVFTV